MHTKFWSENLKVREFGRPRRRWEDNIIMDLREVGWEGMDRMHLAQNRDRGGGLVNSVMNIRVSYYLSLLKETCRLVITILSACLSS